MLDTVKNLCTLHGVSGYEDEVRDYILTRAIPYADRIITDTMGNLMIFRKGDKTPEQRIMLTAHMDEVGLIITDIDEDGYLHFDFIGGIDQRTIIGKRVEIGTNSIPGVIGIKAYHLVSAAEEKTVPKVTDMYIDIGASNQQEATAKVSLGDYGVFYEPQRMLGSDCFKARALDDRVGCAVLLCLLESETMPIDCWFVFTVQEEVGTRGAKIAAQRLEAEVALVLEGTTAADLPSLSGGKEICKLGEGVVIPFMDKGAIYDRQLYAMLTGLAEEKKIPWQTKRQIAGGTDGSAIQKSGSGVKTAVAAIPIRNIHTPVSIGRIDEMEMLLQLAKAFLMAVGERGI